MILNPIQSMRSLSVNFTGLFTKSAVLVGKVRRLSVSYTQLGDTCPFFWQKVKVFSPVILGVLRQKQALGFGVTFLDSLELMFMLGFRS